MFNMYLSNIIHFYKHYSVFWGFFNSALELFLMQDKCKNTMIICAWESSACHPSSCSSSSRGALSYWSSWRHPSGELPAYSSSGRWEPTSRELSTNILIKPCYKIIWYDFSTSLFNIHVYTGSYLIFVTGARVKRMGYSLGYLLGYLF